MGSEISGDRSNAQDLREAQDAYRKRRQTLEEEGQSELEKVRKDNQEKLRTEIGSGEAAVNHVRTNSAELVEQSKRDTDQRLTYERKSLARGLQTEREHARDELDGLEDGKKTRSNQLHRQIVEEDHREAALRERESEATTTISQEQAERRAKMMRQEQAEMSNFGRRVEEQKRNITQKSHKELDELSDKGHHDLEHLQAETKKAYDQQTQLSHEQLQNQRSQESKNLENDRQTFGKNETTLRDRAQKSLHDEQVNDNQKFADVQRENENEMQRLRDKGVKNMEKTRAYYDGNIATIEKKGDERVNEQTDIQNQRLRILDTDNKIALKKAKEEHEQVLQNDQDAFKKQSDQSHGFYRQSLLEQRKEYDSAFKKNLQAFENQVREQREALAKSLVREKREVMEDVGRYNSKNQDPFYRLSQPNAELKESDNHYIIETRVPEHEKDNVKVVVHDNKVVVQGERRFEDKVEDVDGKIATNSYQTYRQEIPLEHPVREKFATRHYENGVLTVKIPKA